MLKRVKTLSTSYLRPFEIPQNTANTSNMTDTRTMSKGISQPSKSLSKKPEMPS